MLDELRGGEQSVGALVERLAIRQPAAVSARVDAQRRIYRLNPERLREIDENHAVAHTDDA